MTDELYKNFVKAQEDLIKALNEGKAKVSRDYYQSQVRVLDEARINKVRIIADEIRVVAFPKGRQRVYSFPEIREKMLEWHKKLQEI